MSETLHGESPKVGARALQGLGRGAKGRAVRSETRWHVAGTGRRGGAKGHKKGPTAGSGSGRRGVGARRSLDFAQEFGGVGVALGSGLREVAAREGAVAEELV